MPKSQKSLKEERQSNICIAEKKLIKENPLELIEAGYLSIKTKDAQLVKLKLNDAQMPVFELIKERIALGKPIRIWILKARQEGMSTLIEAIIYALTSQVPNINTLILSDIKEHANNLFDMSKLYHEKLSIEKPHIPPNLKKSNEKKLEFDGIHSQIIIATAENTMAATSHTFHIVHLSECSKYRDLDALMADLNQTVPKIGASMIIGETTANGMEAFYDEWIRAVEGKSDWIPVFIPWFFLEEYSRPLDGGELYPIHGISFSADATKTQFLEHEQALKKEYDLTDEQLNWRRWSIVNDCKGRIRTFNQENPGTWKEAFQMSGENFFDNQGMGNQHKVRPIAIGNLFEENLKTVFRVVPEGKIKLYEYPKSYEEYIIAGDASEAIGEDEGSALVLNKRLNSTAAVANGQYSPEVLGDIMIKLGNYYNQGLCVPENKGYGTHLAKVIYENYGNIYRTIKTDKGQQVVSEQLGFNTNVTTRPEMLSRLNEEIRVNATKLIDGDLINQCNTFIINSKTKKAEAALNKQDGLVICRSIAGQVRHLKPYVPPAKDIQDSKLYDDIVSDNEMGGF